VNKKLAKKKAERERTEPKRKELRRATQTEWRSRDEVAPVVEVVK